MAVTVPVVASVVVFNPGSLSTGTPGAPTGAGSAPPVPLGGVPVINLAATGNGAFVGTLTYPILPSGLAPALVLSAAGAGGLVARLLLHLSDGSGAIVNNVPHSSVNPAGPCWAWPQQAVWPGANS